MIKKQKLLSKSIEHLDNFSGKKILVIGDLMVDQYIFGEATRLSPEAPVPVVDVESVEYRLGGAANTINNIVSLGGKVYAVGVIGGDENGRWLIKELRRKGVTVSDIVVDPQRPTTTKTRVMAGHHQIVRFDRESKEEINPSLTDKIVHSLKDRINNVDCIAISDYDKGLINVKLINSVVKLSHKFNKPIVVDPKVKHHLQYHGVTIVKTNTKNASTATCMAIMDEKSLLDVGFKLLDNLRSDAIIITQGKDGMTIFKRCQKKATDVIHMPAFAREVYDVTGAGDVVTAVLALALSAGASIEEAAFLSNVAAGIKVRKIGTNVVRKDELRTFLSSLNPRITERRIYAK
ncbi:D-glycero-beta-D-manno-heptose-7-phosphate kinase [candidate division KSB1 bacterium]|nr:MAG: D-glycero-beta-D-manno-heptose-7-phosphate kinase [candidate division KSB1 bacterium]